MPTRQNMPAYSNYSRMVNEDSSGNYCDIDSSHGEFASLNGFFEADQLRLIADAMDELVEMHDAALPSAAHRHPPKEKV